MSVRSALGKEMGLRLMPGCRWSLHSMGMAWVRAGYTQTEVNTTSQ